MGAVRRLLEKLRILARRNSFRSELEEEMDFHRDAAESAFVGDGMTADAAKVAARRQFGNATRLKEQSHEMISFRAETVWQDLRFALRQLRRSPGFTVTAILILALGICASVAIFAFVDAALIRRLPYRQPAQLVAVYESTPSGPRFHLSYLDYLDWKQSNRVFSMLEAYDNARFLLKTPAGVQQAEGAVVSAGFFRALGVAPMLGRDFYRDEDKPGAAATVLLSYEAWQKRFSGRGDVLGRTVTLSSSTSTIIGVLPEGFHFAPTGSAEFWMALQPSPTEDRGSHGVSAIARLKDGVSMETAAAEMHTIAARLAQQYPDADQGRGATVVSLSDVIVGDVRPILWTLLSGTALLLLIAFANIASLLLVRTEARRREIALRGALGASRSRIAGQFITEGLVLAGLGGTAGCVCAWAVIRVLTGLIPPAMMDGMPYLQRLSLLGHPLFFASAICGLAAVLFSAVPMLRLTAEGRQSSLAEGGRAVAGTLWRRLGSDLVIVELATAMVLLVSAGLLAKSFYHLLRAPIGIQPGHVATLHLLLPHESYPKDGQVTAMADQLLERAAGLPGVSVVSVGHSLPIGSIGGNTTFEIIGRPSVGAPHEVNQREVSAGYFTTLEARLLRGRFFHAGEDARKPHVAIINAAMARQYFAGEDPIGKRISHGAPEPSIEIIGVVDDIKEGPLDQTTRGVLYVPFDQDPDRTFHLLVRGSQTEASLVAAMTAMVHGIDPGIVTFEGESMTERIRESPSAYLHRSSAWLVGGFAALALLLGSVGLYGVLAYSVSQRTREIGVRMALGAQRSSVYRLILTEAVRLIVFGLAAGSICSLVAATLTRKLLFGVQAWDVSTFAAVAAVLAIAAMLASYLPARRAASVNPVEALRAE